MRIVVCSLLLSLMVVGCTPEHAIRTGEEMIERSRLKDAVVIRRNTNRLLSHQAQLCLISNKSNTEPGLALLRNMQAGMSGYFLAVGVENQALDYGAVMQELPCPGANYLLFIEPVVGPCKENTASCDNGVLSQLLITIFNADNSGVADRVTLTLQRSWLSMAMDAQADQRTAFEQLARTLTGAEPR